MAIESTNKNFNNLVQYAKLLEKSYRGGNATVVNRITVDANVRVGARVYPKIGGEPVFERHTVTCVLLSSGEIIFEDLPRGREDNPNNHGFQGCKPYVVRVY